MIEPNPLHAFKFQVQFRKASLPSTAENREAAVRSRSVSGGLRADAEDNGAQVDLCRGAFSEITGLEATVEPFAINEGGVNWGQYQRVGRTTFSTVILKRGMTTSRSLWDFFRKVHFDGGSRFRLNVRIQLQDYSAQRILEWTLDRSMPVKLKLADLSGSAQDVGVEELHLVHEGLTEKVYNLEPNGGAVRGAR